MLDPELASALLSRATPRPTSQTMTRLMGRLRRLTVMGAVNGEDRNRSPAAGPALLTVP